jgi:hypothetical protein
MIASRTKPLGPMLSNKQVWVLKAKAGVLMIPNAAGDTIGLDTLGMGGFVLIQLKMKAQMPS